jgi:hypothetical protein
MKIKKAQDACFDEWRDNYNTDNEDLAYNRHNRVMPKIALVGVSILLILTLVAIL